MESHTANNENALQALQKQLQSSGIDTSLWGKGQAKTLEHLQKEIETGETILIKIEN
jgi:hypothetical protein